MDKIHFASFNTAGIRSNIKRKTCFSLLKRKKYDIVFLQETHSSSEDCKFWEKQWGSKIYFAQGSSTYTAGCAITFKNSLNTVIDNTIIDDNGRYIILEVSINEVNFILVNVYGPNVDDASFFHTLFTDINSNGPDIRNI